MGLFGKKKEEEAPAATEAPAADPAAAPGAAPAGAPPAAGGGGAKLERLEAKFSSFFEMQKAATERFTRINEQIGELRAMMLEREKAGQLLEAKATQAIDLVSSIKPDKFMVDLRKIDFKIEALKANVESNENVMQNTITEMKDMRSSIKSFKGMEEVVKLNQEVKTELMEMKKLGATIDRHSNKVETIYSELQKRMKEFAVLNDTITGLDKNFKDIASDFDGIKVKISDFVVKKEFEDVLGKMSKFEKHAGNVLTLLNTKIATFEKEFTAKQDEKFKKTDQLLKGFETLAAKTPDLDKYFNLLSDEAKKGAKKEPAAKIKAPGEETPLPEGKKKEGMLSKIKAKVGK